MWREKRINSVYSNVFGFKVDSNGMSQSHNDLNSQKITRMSSIHMTVVDGDTVSNNNLTVEKGMWNKAIPLFKMGSV